MGWDLMVFTLGTLRAKELYMFPTLSYEICVGERVAESARNS